MEEFYNSIQHFANAPRNFEPHQDPVECFVFPHTCVLRR